jgi:hypothetical protein
MAEENKQQNAESKTQENTETKTEPQYMTSEQFNRAATARDARMKKDFEKMLADFAAKLSSPPSTQEAESEEEEEGGEEVQAQQEGESKKAAPKRPTRAEIEAKKAMAEIKALKKQQALEKEEAAKAKLAAQTREESVLATAALTGAGVLSVKGALALLKTEGRIGRNADGEVVFKMPRDLGGERFEEEMSLEEGIKEWLATEDGKIYQPPRGVEGSNNNPGKGTTRRPGDKLSKQEAAAILAGFITKR